MSMVLSERRRRRRSRRRTPPRGAGGKFVSRRRSRGRRRGRETAVVTSSLGERRRRRSRRSGRRGRSMRESVMGMIKSALGERRIRKGRRHAGRFAPGPAGAAFRRRKRRPARARRRGRRVIRRVRGRARRRGREAFVLAEIVAQERRRRRRRPGRARRRSREVSLMEQTLLSERRRRRGRGRRMGGRRRRARDWGFFGEALPNQAMGGRLAGIWDATKKGGLVVLGLFGARILGNAFQKYVPAPASLQRWWGVLGASVTTAILIAATRKMSPALRTFLIAGSGAAIIQKTAEALNLGALLAQTGTAGLGDMIRSGITGEPFSGLAGLPAWDGQALGGVPHQHDALGACTIGCGTAPLLQYQSQPCGQCVQGAGVAQSTQCPGMAGVPHQHDGMGACTIGCGTAPLLQYQSQPCGQCGMTAGGVAQSTTCPAGMAGGVQPAPAPAVALGESLRGDPTAAAIIANLQSQYASQISN